MSPPSSETKLTSKDHFSFRVGSDALLGVRNTGDSNNNIADVGPINEIVNDDSSDDEDPFKDRVNREIEVS